MKKLLLPLFILVITSTFAQDQEVQITNNETVLAGSLLDPKFNPDSPVVLFIAGSGPTDRNGNNPQMINNSLKMMADWLFENNYPSLRYDKRGTGASGKNFNEEDLRFEDFVSDAAAWVDYLKKKYKHVVIVGHSEGSLIGILVSQQKDVDAFISIAGTSRPINEVLEEQLLKQVPGWSDLISRKLDSLAEGHQVSSLPLLEAVFRPSVQPYLISWMAYNPVTELAKLEIPITIAQGENDLQVPVSDALQLSKAKEGTSLAIFTGMNHILKDVGADMSANMASYSIPDLELHPLFKEDLLKWVTQLDESLAQ